jgi:hypothetical protein
MGQRVPTPELHAARREDRKMRHPGAVEPAAKTSGELALRGPIRPPDVVCMTSEGTWRWRAHSILCIMAML